MVPAEVVSEVPEEDEDEMVPAEVFPEVPEEAEETKEAEEAKDVEEPAVRPSVRPKTILTQGFSLKVLQAKGRGTWFWALLMRIPE